MSKFENKYRIESARLREYDYSTPNYYYVTINTLNHIPYFGEVIETKMKLNYMGIIVNKFWREIPKHYPTVELDYFIIMPNHLHGIIIMNCAVETGHAPSLHKPTLSNIVGSFKSAVTKKIRKELNSKFYWQSRFYDRIIRNEEELLIIRNYILQNPLRWSFDNAPPMN